MSAAKKTLTDPDAATSNSVPNVREVVPFLAVSDMVESLRFYGEGLGFDMREKWVVGERVRWCRLQLGSAALMLQEFPTTGHDSWRPTGKVGEGVSLCFICTDALASYREAIARNVAATEPVVGNGMWVTTLLDPDGYKLLFESETDLPNGTRYATWSQA